MYNLFVLVVAALMGLAVPTAKAGPQDHRQPVAKNQPLKFSPNAHHQIMHKGNLYYFSGGRFYSFRNGIRVTVVAPLGAVIPALPNGYVTVGTDPNQYFHYAGIYYRHGPNGYFVIERPPVAHPPARVRHKRRRHR